MGTIYQEYILDKLQRAKQTSSDNCYTGLTVNDYGDETCNIGKENLPINPLIFRTVMPTSIETVDPNGYIDKFIKFSNHKRANIIPLYPVSTQTNTTQTLAFKKYAYRIKKFWEDKKVKFHDTLEDSLLDPSLMYNANYHPKDSGRKKRTKNIIIKIKNRINNTNS
jgi:hypothetical protein